MHLHHPHPFFLETGIIYAMLMKIPVVIHCHGVEITMKGWPNIFAQIYNNTLLRFDLMMSDRIVMHTHKLVESSKLVKKYENKVRILRSGVDTDWYAGKVKNSLKKELKIENNKIILCVGQLRDYKRIDILIDAFCDINKEKINTQLIIVGKGDKENELKLQAEKLGLCDKIIFAGFVDDDKLLDYYSIADVFVLPSPTIAEGFGLVALEAAAMEVPVIVTKGAGISEAFKTDKIGIVIEPSNIDAMKNAILDVLKNPKKANLDAKKAKNIIEKSSWKNLAIDYIKVYEELIRFKRM